MPNPLPIGTEYDETYLGLRVRVVGHHKDQFGQVVNDVVKVSELPPGGRRVRKAPGPLAPRAPAARPKPRRRRRSYYRPRPQPYPQTAVKTPRTKQDNIAAWAWGIIIVGGILLYSTCDAYQRTHFKYVGPPMAPVRHRR